jgi:hypothetical protein
MSSLAGAQTGTASIAGVVKDTSGAVLPGVTVAASSPVLIEKTRTVVTDGEGLYKIVSLPNGTYSVTFTLPSFGTVKRDGIELTSNFTASINAELKVGSLDETVTVSGQSPVVDVQNASTRNQISREVLDTVPTNKTLEAYAALTPGITMASTGQDVGGSKGETYVQLRIHGTRNGDSKSLIDGFETNDWSGRVFVPNPSAAQEVSVELGNGLAESPANGVYVNYIPKSGSNRFSGTFIGNYTGSGMQSNPNLTDDLQSRGVTRSALPRIKKIWDVNGSIGGPIVQDRLWFYTAERSWGSNGTVVNGFYTITSGTPFRANVQTGQITGNLSGGNPFLYARDLSRPSFNDFKNWQTTNRATWQVTPRNKLDFSYDWEYRCDCHRDLAATLAPEAAAIRTYHPKIPAVTWTFPASNKLLIEAGTAFEWLLYGPAPQPETPIDTISSLEQNVNVRFLAVVGDGTGGSAYGRKYNYIQNSRFAMSYVTGSHAVKVGLQLRQGIKEFGVTEASPINYTLNNGRPVSVQLYAYPLVFHSDMRALMGLFAQDQWTLRRLTLSGGLRFDYENAYVPPWHHEAGAFVPARDFSGLDCQPCWKDLSPRMSAAYDLFGNGKTAIKVSVGRYTTENNLGIADANNPLAASNATTSRSWDDFKFPEGDPRRGNYKPDCNFADQADTTGECGPGNPNFGKVIITNTYADDVTRANRGYNWATSASIQHELRPGVALNFGYFRTSWQNFTVADAQGVTPADYKEFCITLPAGVPNAGQQLCGLYDLTTSATVPFGADSTNLLTHIATGDFSDRFNGIDLTANARLRHGAFLQGGFSTGAQVTSSCTAIDSPSGAVGVVTQPAGSSAATLTTRSVNPTSFCRVAPAFWHPQFKFSGSHPLPYGFQVSGVFQNLPGIPILASLVVPNSQAIGLGRPLSGGVANVTVTNIIEPMTQYEDRLNQLDLRFIRNFRIANIRLQGTFDIYNTLNASTVLNENYQYGTAWKTPTAVLDARIFKFGIQMNF